jgi:hypothetical protein
LKIVAGAISARHSTPTARMQQPNMTLEWWEASTTRKLLYSASNWAIDSLFHILRSSRLFLAVIAGRKKEKNGRRNSDKKKWNAMSNTRSNNRNCLSRPRRKCRMGAMEVPRLEGDREIHRTETHGKIRPPLLVVVARRTWATSVYLRNRLIFRLRRWLLITSKRLRQLKGAKTYKTGKRSL